MPRHLLLRAASAKQDAYEAVATSNAGASAGTLEAMKEGAKVAVEVEQQKIPVGSRKRWLAKLREVSPDELVN